MLRLSATIRLGKPHLIFTMAILAQPHTAIVTATSWANQAQKKIVPALGQVSQGAQVLFKRFMDLLNQYPPLKVYSAHPGIFCLSAAVLCGSPRRLWRICVHNRCGCPGYCSRRRCPCAGLLSRIRRVSAVLGAVRIAVLCGHRRADILGGLLWAQGLAKGLI